jgi:hypothetical protein
MHHWVSFALKDPLCVGSVYRIRECADENPVIPLDTIKAFPGATVTYKLFGGKHERHYGHYDLLCSRTVSSFSKLPNVFCTLQFPYITVTKNNDIRSPLITSYLLV